MDIQSLRTLMEINALQSLGAVQTYSSQPAPSSMFNEVLSNLLQTSSISNTISTSSSDLLNDLLYNGASPVFRPDSINISETKALSENADFNEIIKHASTTYEIPEKLIKSVIQQESSFNPDAVSHSGAAGLMQLMPGTAKFLGVTDRFNPAQNIMGGTKYLRQMLNQFGDRIDLALAAYNAGPGNVRKYEGIPPFKETEQYVHRVLTHFNS